MQRAILDTDTLSHILRRRNSHLLLQAADYLRYHGKFAFSALTRYEQERGLRLRNARVQLAQFVMFCQQSLLLPVSDAVLEKATDLWVIGQRGGHPHRDADLIIAATALDERCTLITGNMRHFSWVPNLTIEDWTTR